MAKEMPSYRAALLAVACGECGQGADHPCVTVTSGKEIKAPAEWHKKRWMTMHRTLDEGIRLDDMRY